MPDHTGIALTPTDLEKHMADDKAKTGGQDRQRINVNEAYELRDWAAKFGVTTDQLKQAVADVGDRAAEVEQHLKGRRR
jgi:hypothetical protein